MFSDRPHRHAVITCLTYPCYVVLRAMQEEELREFLLPAEDAILAIQQSCESGDGDFQGMLLQAELLVRDVVLLEGLTAN